jgi:hypothetical protein
MAIWRRWPAPKRRSASAISIDRKVIRFRRLVEKHGEVLDLFADLQDKQSGEYILDRQYIEARLDLAYESVRRMLYDMHVVSDVDTSEGYDQLDRLRSVSEKILRHAREAPEQRTGPQGEDALDWETLALQALFQDLTRAPTYGPDAACTTETEPAPPESLTEWAGWGHVKAAQWIAEHLPSVSPAPFTDLSDEETGEFRVQVFVLGGVRAIDDTLQQCISREPWVHRTPSSLLPLRIFLEGLCGRAGEAEGRQLCAERKKRLRGEEVAAQFHLYAGDDFLLLRLPPFLPLRLFWCSLSLQPCENLIYLYGANSPLPPGQDPLTPFLAEKVPFPSYRCGISGRWMYWASHLSRAQGEERVRMLGHAVAQGLTVRGTGAIENDLSGRLHEGVAGFLKQTAMPQREA